MRKTNIQRKDFKIMKYIKLFEQYGKTYTEIEFVCHNTETNSNTTKENQLALYNELKSIERIKVGRTRTRPCKCVT